MSNAVKKPANDQAAMTAWEDFASQNAAPQWVQDLRAKSYAAFARTGVPTTRSERYKYTDIAKIDQNNYFPYAAADIQVKGETAYVSRIDLNALPQWAQELAQAAPAGEAQYQDMALWHANNAYLRDGLVVDVPAKTIAEQPLDITLTGQDGSSIVPRSLIRIGANAECTIIERHNGTGAFWNNRLTQIIVEKGAKLRHYRIQDNGDQAVYTQNTHIIIDRDASYEAFTLTTGSALSRNQIHVELNGENGDVRLDGINLLQGAQHADTTITIEHKAPHCRSFQNYKSILNDKAHGVFQGKVHVHRPAQKTDGYQLANALLLSQHAQMDTKPELEIYADDVKCSHGSTTGQIDTAPLFYLRTRGLSESEARLLLMQAFLGPALDQITDDNAREMFGTLCFDWLKGQMAK